jgi:gas vesicle protein
MKNSNKIFTAIAAGAVAGLITGILFAPDKGTETRKKIKKQKQKLADEVKDKINKGKEKFEGFKGNGEQKIVNRAEEFAQESM